MHQKEQLAHIQQQDREKSREGGEREHAMGMDPPR